jgi:hypothetical protein
MKELISAVIKKIQDEGFDSRKAFDEVSNHFINRIVELDSEEKQNQWFFDFNNLTKEDLTEVQFWIDCAIWDKLKHEVTYMPFYTELYCPAISLQKMLVENYKYN